MSDLYIATENSDLTEGRGHTTVTGLYTDPKLAVDAVRGRSVMGVGDGDVYLIELDETGSYKGSLFKRENLFYGYRKGPNGRWGHGYTDHELDPEWETYVRLQKKFGGKHE